MMDTTLLSPWSALTTPCLFQRAHFQLCASPAPSFGYCTLPSVQFLFCVSQLLFHFKPWTLFSLCLILPLYCSCWSEDFKPKLGKFSFARWQLLPETADLQCPGRGGVVTIPHDWAIPWVLVIRRRCNTACSAALAGWRAAAAPVPSVCPPSL